MAGGIGTTYANDFLNAVVNGTTFTAPPARYLALFTANPTDTGGGTETSYTGYSRIAVGSSFGTSNAGTIINSSALSFGQNTGSQVVLTGFAEMDASTGGNIVMWGPLSASYTLTASSTPSFASNTLTFTVS